MRRQPRARDGATAYPSIGNAVSRCATAPAPLHSIALQCSLDHSELIGKRRALHLHGSQTAPLAALIGEATWFRWWQEECVRYPQLVEQVRALDAVVADRAPSGIGS